MANQNAGFDKNSNSIRNIRNSIAQYFVNEITDCNKILHQNQKILSFLCAVVQLRLHFIVLLWGFTGVVGKLITVTTIPLVWYRMLFGSIALAVLLPLMKRSLKITRKELVQLLSVGTLIGLHWLFFFGAIKVSNISVALSTLSTSALFSVFIEALLFKRKIHWYEIVFSVVVSLCIAVLFNVKPDFWLGIIFGLICSLLSALFSIYNAKLQPKIASGKIIFYEMLGGLAVVSFALLFTSDSLQSISLSYQDLIYVLILGTILTVYPMIESVRLMQHISPFTLLLTINLEPLYGIALAYFIFKDSERMNWLFYLIAIVMVGTIVANHWMSKQQAKLNTPS